MHSFGVFSHASLFLRISCKCSCFKTKFIITVLLHINRFLLKNYTVKWDVENWGFALLILILLVHLFLFKLQVNFSLEDMQKTLLYFLYLVSFHSNFIYSITSNLCFSKSVVFGEFTQYQTLSVQSLFDLCRKCSILIFLCSN